MLAIEGGGAHGCAGQGGACHCAKEDLFHLEGGDRGGRVDDGIVNDKGVALNTGCNQRSGTDTVGAEKGGTDGILALNKGGGETDAIRSLHHNVCCFKPNLRCAAVKRGNIELVGFPNGHDLVGIGKNGADSGDTKRIGIQINDFGDFTIHSRDNTGNVGDSTRFGETGERDGNVGANKEGVRVVRNIEVCIVFGGIRPFLVRIAVAWFGDENFSPCRGKGRRGLAHEGDRRGSVFYFMCLSRFS
jgi:hypothetical protein